MRVGVVGVGHLGKSHARVYAKLDAAELVGVYDANLERCREIAAEYGTRAFERVDDLVAEVDAASIVVPTPAHLESARPFIENGKSVLVEKPLAATLAEADELIRLADANDVVLQVGHIERFNPVLNAALRFIDNPVFIECDRIHPFSMRSTDVSVVLDLMIHDIDLILHMIPGEVESVDALGAPVLSPTDDLATARLTFDNGCTAMVKTSRVAMNRSRKIRIFCPRSYLSLDLVAKAGMRIYLGEDYDPQDFLDAMGRVSDPAGEAVFLAKHLRTEQLEIVDYDALEAEVGSFLEAFAESKEPKVSGRAGRRAMQAASAIEASIDAHRRRVEDRL